MSVLSQLLEGLARAKGNPANWREIAAIAPRIEALRQRGAWAAPIGIGGALGAAELLSRDGGA